MAATLIIRDETESDFDAIRHVHLRAFPTQLEARLVDQLRSGGQLAISLVALLDQRVVAHVALSPVSVDGQPIGLGLAPVAVLPARQRCGIGSALIRESLAVSKAREAPLVVVLGDPAFYSRFGFTPASALGLRDPYQGGDAFQAIVLTTDRRLRAGLVQYAPAFAAFG